MEHTLVAVFDTETHANDAMNELLSCGIARDDMNIHASQRTDISEGASGQVQPEDESFGEKIKSFFRNMFGSGNEEQGSLYAEAARRGHYVLTVVTRDEQQMTRASDILNQHSPINIEERAAEWKSSGWSPEADYASGSAYAAGSEGIDTSEPIEIEEASRRSGMEQARPAEEAQQGRVEAESKAVPVVEEQLRVGKRVVQRGGVRVVQHVTETPVEESIPLHEERVTVERHRADRPAGAEAAGGLKESTVEMHETVEEPVIEKAARVVEEVVLKKEAVDRTETVQDTVRRADLEVEQLETQRAASEQAEPSFDDADFRTHWQQSFSQAGGRYEDYAPAYRYGYTMHGNNQYRGRTWEEVEPQIRADWESKHAGSPWEKAKDAVRVGWERLTG